MELDVLNEEREKAYQHAIIIALVITAMPFAVLIALIPSVNRYIGVVNHQLQNDLFFCEETTFNFYDYTRINLNYSGSDELKNNAIGITQFNTILEYLNCSPNADECWRKWRQVSRKIRSLSSSIFEELSPPANHFINYMDELQHETTMDAGVTDLGQPTTPTLTESATDTAAAKSGNIWQNMGATKAGSGSRQRISTQPESVFLVTNGFVPSTAKFLDEFLVTPTIETVQAKGVRTSNNNQECRCAALPGIKGLPGRKGQRGAPGAPGAPGLPARLPCQPPVDLKKICADPCPVGKQGKQGPTGPPGDKGSPGVPGAHGKNGEDGKIGPPGPRGPPGIPGLDGDVGDPGADATPAPFIPGPPGSAGDAGPVGPPGPRGMPGIDGPPGPLGKRGEPGENGLAGRRGSRGLIGPIGKVGPDGHVGVCPTYCATDGGVFFVKPPEWFED